MELAGQIVALLTPFMPYLLKAGESAAQEAGKNLGEGAWASAKALWAKLRPKVEAKPAALEAAQDVAANPDDEDAQAALRLQLKKLLNDDPALAEEIAGLWEQARAAGVTVANRSVVIRGDAFGNTIVTGDGNVVG